MSAQRYTSEVARERMADGRCPECGNKPEEHTGWGSYNCTLTDNGVAQRIAQFEQDEEYEALPVEVVDEDYPAKVGMCANPGLGLEDRGEPGEHG